MTVDEMLSKMSMKELNYWKAFHLLEPFGPREELRRTLLVVCAVLNTVPQKPGSRKVFKVDDYLPDLEELEEKLFSEDEDTKIVKAREALKAFAKDMNKSLEKKNKKKIKRVRRKN